MAPEIVDLISDDEELDMSAGSSSNTKNHTPVKPPSTSGPKTINPALLTRIKPLQTSSDHRSSTAGSHTERDSPSYDPTKTLAPDSPLFFASPSLAPKDTDKGKGRADPIPEIDLSQDTDGENTPLGGGDETWDYANGEFTEEDALKQAIALSLQETTPQRAEKRQDADVGLGASSSTPSRKTFTVRTDESMVSPPLGQNGAVNSLPDWHTSPTKPRGTLSLQPERPATFGPAISSVDAQVPAVAPVTKTPAALAPPETSHPNPKAVSATEPQTARSTFSFAGLNRQQMEAERLARLKRKHEGTKDEQDKQEGHVSKAARIAQASVARDKAVSPPPLRQPERHKGADREDTRAPQLPTRTNFVPAIKNAPQPDTPSNTVSLENDNHGISSTKLYPEGIALKTYIAGFPSARTISFPALISPASNLDSVLLSSFIWDFDWLLPHFDTRRTRFQLVMHAKSPAEREIIRQDWLGVPNVRLTMPPMDGNVNCMHSKLMLLFYKNEVETRWKDGQRCRIAVPTANLVDFDWGVGGFMENTVWVIDLPLKRASAESRETQFQKSLKQFLRAQTVPDDVLLKLDQFDFSKTAQYGFVHTIGGMHSGQAWRLTGLCGLGRTVTELGLETIYPVQMDYVTSSVGSLNDDFMSSMYLAAQGDSGLTAYTRRLKKISVGKQLDNWKDCFRFYYPSDGTVRASKGGARRAGTICFSAKWWEGPNFPKSNMLDCVSVRNGILMHNKLLFVRHTSQLGRPPSSGIGWTYVGSANLSESAWGRLVQDKATKEPRLNCRNWECGVVVPLSETESEAGGRALTGPISAGLAPFADHIPVPMRCPGASVKKPWTMVDSTFGG